MTKTYKLKSKKKQQQKQRSIWQRYNASDLDRVSLRILDSVIFLLMVIIFATAYVIWP